MQHEDKRLTKGAALFLLALVNIFWGMSFIASKYVLSAGMPPMTLAFWRYVFATLALVFACLVKKQSWRIARRDIPALILSALTGVTLYYYFEYTGMIYTTASNASLIVALVPVFTLLYGMLFRKARLGLVQGLSVLLSLAGIYLVTRSGTGEDAAGALKGDLLILGCCLCWVAYIEVSKRLRGSYPSLTLTAWQAVIALISLAPFALIERARWVPVPPSAWLCILGLALICSALCYYLYAQALSVLSPLTTALFININPIAAMLGGVLLLGERMGALQLLGAALVMGGILIICLPRPQAKKAT